MTENMDPVVSAFLEKERQAKERIAQFRTNEVARSEQEDRERTEREARAEPAYNEICDQLAAWIDQLNEHLQAEDAINKVRNKYSLLLSRGTCRITLTFKYLAKSGPGHEPCIEINQEAYSRDLVQIQPEIAGSSIEWIDTSHGYKTRFGNSRAVAQCILEALRSNGMTNLKPLNQ